MTDEEYRKDLKSDPPRPMKRKLLFVLIGLVTLIILGIVLDIGNSPDIPADPAHHNNQ